MKLTFMILNKHSRQLAAFIKSRIVLSDTNAWNTRAPSHRTMNMKAILSITPGPILPKGVFWAHWKMTRSVQCISLLLYRANKQ